MKKTAEPTEAAPKTINPKILNLEEVARELNVPRRTVRVLFKTHALRKIASSPQRAPLFDVEDVAALKKNLDSPELES